MDGTNELYDLIMLYKKEIEPYEFTYLCEFGTTVKFRMETREVCHLLFGDLKNKNIANAKLYKGQSGYEAILNKQVTSVPPQLAKEYKSKSIAFSKLPEILKSPEVIYFNSNIVPTSKRGLHSRINGDFLLYKEIDNKKVHFFLKKVSNKVDRLVPYSAFHNSSNDYTINQIKLKVMEVEVTEKENK